MRFWRVTHAVQEGMIKLLRSETSASEWLSAEIKGFPRPVCNFMPRQQNLSAETPAAREGGLEVLFSGQAENQVQEVASVLWP